MHAHTDHPRPDSARAEWRTLDGEWEFEFDPTNILDGDERMLEKPFQRRIRVPFVYQSPLSGIGDRGMYPTVWYRKSFDIPEGWEKKRLLLHFGAVDYRCTVRVNGNTAGSHTGGYTPFCFDITPWLRKTGNTILVKVDDNPDISQPRGKQSWGSSFACWYTPMSGIWQSVWLEAVPETWIAHHTVEAVPEGGRGMLHFTVIPERPEAGAHLRVSVSRNGSEVAQGDFPLRFPSTRVSLPVGPIELWSPETPALYDYTLTLTGGSGEDIVESYCAFRTVGLTEDEFLLNGEPRFLRLVLDQGFWPESLYTPPSEEAIIADIRLAQQMGFDGCRKHMKLEDPRFLYHADRLGFLVWSELPAPYEFTARSQLAVLADLHGMIRRDRNHPSIITWVIYNESWGVRDVMKDPEIRNWLSSLMDLTRSLDPSRPAVDNDGWHHVVTDLLTYHSYAQNGSMLSEHHEAYLAGGAPVGRPLLAEPGRLPSRPRMASEFGGIGFRMPGDSAHGWGYAGIPETGEEFLVRFEELVGSVYSLRPAAGFCYTQLTDVEQEINGLLTPARKPKFPVESIRRIIRGE